MASKSLKLYAKLCAAIYFSRTETHGFFRGLMIQRVISRSKPNPLSVCFVDSPAMIDCYLELWAEIIFFSLSWFCQVFRHSYWKEALEVGVDTLRCWQLPWRAHTRTDHTRSWPQTTSLQSWANIPSYFQIDPVIFCGRSLRTRGQCHLF